MKPISFWLTAKERLGRGRIAKSLNFKLVPITEAIPFHVFVLPGSSLQCQTNPSINDSFGSFKQPNGEFL